MRDYHIGAAFPVRAAGVLAIMLVVAAILLAGATREGHLLNAGVRLMALLVLVVTAVRLRQRPLRPEWKRPLILLAAMVAIPLFQLIPLPPLVWRSLPGGGEVAAIYAAANMPAPWHGLGLNPQGSLNAALALLPGAAMFAVGLTLDTRARLGVAVAAVVVALAGTLLGIVQVGDGPESALRLYETTNASAAVGFFSNRNHQASLQLVAMPLVAVALSSWSRGAPWRRMTALVTGGALLLVLAIATVLSESRAGMLLYLPVVAACGVMVVRERLPRWPARTVLAALAGLLVLAVAIGLVFLWSRPDIVEVLRADARLRAIPIVTAEAVRHLPFGTGLGTFDEVYRSREAVETLRNAYVNHAHNDYLEVWLETGLPGLAVVALFLLWFARTGFDAWRQRGVEGDLACAGSIIVATLALHSLVDYPLRTGAMSALFGFACALMLPFLGQTAARPAAEALEAPRTRRRVRLPRGARTQIWLPGGDGRKSPD